MNKREKKKWDKLADFFETEEGIEILKENEKINIKNQEKIQWIYLDDTNNY